MLDKDKVIIFKKIAAICLATTPQQVLFMKHLLSLCHAQKDTNLMVSFTVECRLSELIGIRGGFDKRFFLTIKLIQS